MQKIMFNDKYRLTKAVLLGRKTNTRRDELSRGEQNDLVCLEKTGGHKPVVEGNRIVVRCSYGELGVLFSKPTRYKVGEVVAVAQSYNAAGYKISPFGGTPAGMINIYKNEPLCGNLVPEKGWKNKMFVLPELMPRVIQITDIRLERLQDISDEDCIKEGIFEDITERDFHGRWMDDCYYYQEYGEPFENPREAYADLIDKVSGKGTWDRNPFVVVYDFELVR